MKRVALHSLGCKVNAYETEAMTRLFENSGYEIVPFSEEADIYVINTCTVTNMADRKSRQMLHRARKKNPGALVVAVGCYVQADEKRALADEAVDLVVGNNRKNQIVSLVEQYAKGQSAVIDINHTGEYEPMEISTTTEHTRAFMKVQDGCNQFCSYCLIPYVRGRVRSRSLTDVLAEGKRLAANGFREIVLTGIHLSSYGSDLDEETDLLTLIREIHEIKGVDRIRLGSLEPRVITERFASALAALPKVCPHFHLSLQSGCDSVLVRMNRHYTTAEYAEKCGILRRYFENPAITTDVIVGFPGETEEEFDTTVSFLRDMELYEAHVFKFSRRRGTKADVMENQVPEQVKTTRSARLLSLVEECSGEYRTRFLGKETEVLFEEQAVLDGVPCWVGHTREYVKAALPSGKDLSNRMVRVIPQRTLQGGILLCRPV